jgi:hypothetical protein
VRLRPVSEDDLPVLEKLRQDPDAAGEFAWFGWSNLRGLRQGWGENGLIGRDGGMLMVVRDDERS